MPQRTHWQVTSVSLHELIDRFHRGLLRIPRYGRPFQRNNDDVVRIFDSILRGFPIGMIMVTEGSADAGPVSLGGVHITAPATDQAWSVVDGLQRLTAIVGTLGGTDSDERFRVAYDLTAHELVGIQEHSPREDVLPLSVAADGRRVLAWLRKRPWFDEEQVDQALRVSQALREYRIPLMVIDGADITVRSEIFARMNTSGTSLTRQDIAQVRRVEKQSDDASSMSPGTSSLVESSRIVGFGRPSEALLLRCVDAVGGGVKSTREVFPQVLAFLRDMAGIPHVRLLPWDDALPVLTRFVARFGPPRGRAAELLRRWVWRGATVDAALRPDLDLVLSDLGSSPLGEANRLLRLLEPPTRAWRPGPEATGLDRTSGRLSVLGLLSARPTLLVPVRADTLFEDPHRMGALLEPGLPLAAQSGLTGALLDAGEELLAPLMEKTPYQPWTYSLANHLLHPPVRAGELLHAVRTEPATEDASWLVGHCLDRMCVEALRDRAYDVFTARRTRLVERVIADHVQRYARWGFPDGASLPSLSGPADQDGPDRSSEDAP
jgi:hypothetical protein